MLFHLHLGRIYASENRVSIVSDHGLSLSRRQAIIYTSAGLLSSGPLGINFSEIQNTKLFIHENASENFVCEMAAILSRSKCVNLCSKVPSTRDQ